MSQYRNLAEHCDEKLCDRLPQSDTEGEELRDEQYQDRLYSSEVHATVIPISNTPKKKKNVSALAQH